MASAKKAFQPVYVPLQGISFFQDCLRMCLCACGKCLYSGNLHINCPLAFASDVQWWGMHIAESVGFQDSWGEMTSVASALTFSCLVPRKLQQFWCFFSSTSHQFSQNCFDTVFPGLIVLITVRMGKYSLHPTHVQRHFPLACYWWAFYSFCFSLNK